jgi:glycosyltransferase involved in cell wall biosynthesis
VSTVSAQPRVSIVVPSFNEAPQIVGASLASVRAQTMDDFECIVVDESTDEALARACREVCEADPRFIYIHPSERLGLAGSLNLGLSRARGALIARFDADDLCQPERLALQAAFLDAHPMVDVVGGALEVIDEDGAHQGVRHYPLGHLDIARRMQLTNAMAHPTVMYRRTVVERHGGYDTSFRYSEDLDLWLRWLNAGVRFANLPQVLVCYRQQVTRRNTLHWRYNLRARTRNFGRSFIVRRAAGIGCIAVWSALPAVVQESVFRLLMLGGPRQRDNSIT